MSIGREGRRLWRELRHVVAESCLYLAVRIVPDDARGEVMQRAVDCWAMEMLACLRRADPPDLDLGDEG